MKFPAMRPMIVAACVMGATGIFETSTAAEKKSGLFARKKKEIVVAKKKEAGPLDYPTVGDGTGIDGLERIKVEGIGLVVGLRGTGSDPPPNTYRDQMMAIMRKRDIYQPKEILASPNTAIVLLRAFIPPGAREGDIIDVEVWVPPGDSTTSLAGGRLLEAELFSTVVAGGQRLQGNALVTVEGPVLVNADPNNPENTAVLRKGKIIGQGKVAVDRDFRIVMARELRSGLRTRSLQHRINQRFFLREGNRKLDVASAKDEQLINLKLVRRYRYNIERYLLVVRKIPISVSHSFVQEKLQYLREELLDPSRTIEAALRLEAIGPDSVPVLKEGLESKHEIVRFSAAQTLAYLGDPSGAEELGKLALLSNDYRAYALTALVALDHPISRMTLIKLLDADSVECRYGAFRSLWAYDDRDPIIRGEDLNGEFYLHEIDSKAHPMIHLSRSFRREIVIFNPDQKLRTPVLLKAGNLILTAAAENTQLNLASIEPSPEGTIRRHAESDLRISSVIRAAVSLGATYPDMVSILEQANAKGNLPGRLEVDAMPRPLPLRTLHAIAVAGDQEQAPKQEESRSAIPSLFGGNDEHGQLNLGLSEEAHEDEQAQEKDEPKKRSLFDVFRRLTE